MKTFKFFMVHTNATVPVTLGILPVVDRVSEVILTSKDIASWALEALELLALWGGQKTFSAEGLSKAREEGWDYTCIEVFPVQLGYAYGDGDYPSYSAVYPYPKAEQGSAMDPDLDVEYVRVFIEQLGAEFSAACQAVDAWKSRMRRNFNAALLDLQEGNFFPEEGKKTVLIEDILEKPLYELPCSFSSGPVFTNGPFGATLHLPWERVKELRDAATAAVVAREKAHDAARASAKEARRAFQVRALHNLDAAEADVMRAERGMFPPDELAIWIVQRYVPGAEVLCCDGHIVRHMSLTAKRFERLRQLETAYTNHGAVPARCAGIELSFQVVEAAYDWNYDDEAVPCLLVTVKDLLGSDWTRTVRVSLAPHSSTQSE
jgi:hypothetical protein